MEGIQLSVEKPRDDISIIKVGGYIDTTTSAELEHSLDSLLKAGSFNIIIELGNVDYISSAGLRVLLGTVKRLTAARGSLRISGLNDTVKEVFDISGFSTILAVFATEAEALEGF